MLEPSAGASVPEGEPQRSAWIRERARRLAGIETADPPRVFTDTSSYIQIDRGDLVALGDELYVVCGQEREGRFGIDDQPKYWVKRVVALGTAQTHILKLVFEESFSTRIGEQQFVCRRSADKEAAVLAAVAEHEHFMHGRAVCDAGGNRVRILDFIIGDSLLHWLGGLSLTHEEYVARLLPPLLRELCGCFAGIALLHRRGLCHGDIRNDHILLDAHTGRARWIDFDFDRDRLEFDVWCLGNVLNCAAAKGFVTFHTLEQTRPDLLARLEPGDGSVCYRHRVMNVHRILPAVPPPLARMLERFAVGAQSRYQSAAEVAADLEACTATMGEGDPTPWPRC
jgi:serine/threonine protein kinase